MTGTIFLQLIILLLLFVSCTDFLKWLHKKVGQWAVFCFSSQRDCARQPEIAEGQEAGCSSFLSFLGLSASSVERGCSRFQLVCMAMNYFILWMSSVCGSATNQKLTRSTFFPFMPISSYNLLDFISYFSKVLNNCMVPPPLFLHCILTRPLWSRLGWDRRNAKWVPRVAVTQEYPVLLWDSSNNTTLAF